MFYRAMLVLQLYVSRLVHVLLVVLQRICCFATHLCYIWLCLLPLNCKAERDAKRDEDRERERADNAALCLAFEERQRRLTVRSTAIIADAA